jgi:ATP-dependent helicase/nuclease subunit A
LRKRAPREIARAEILTPSQADEEVRTFSGTAGPFADARRRALARGLLIHRLMQALPEVPAEHRSQAGRTYLDRADTDFAAADRALILDETLRILEHPRFAPLFGAGSRAEVPIIGRIARPAGPPVLVSGQVDRLVVTPDAVLIADYKTNAPAPKRIGDVPKAYVSQLALYRVVLARLYPDRPITAALIFTYVPDLLELSPDDLEQALAAVTSP